LTPLEKARAAKAKLAAKREVSAEKAEQKRIARVAKRLSAEDHRKLDYIASELRKDREDKDLLRETRRMLLDRYERPVAVN
jgi:hypothetical protein